MPLYYVSQDITTMKVDVIVNAANQNLSAGGGVCGAIFKRANDSRLIEECRALAPIPTGTAVITKGYQLKAKHIIHAVGPIYQDGMHHEKQLLRSAYLEALNLAKQYHLESIAFPLISSGIYGYPRKEALNVAIDTLTSFLETNEMDIYLVLFDGKKSIQSNEDLDAYLNANYEEILAIRRHQRYEAMCSPKPISFDDQFEDVFMDMEDTFPELLFKMIDKKGLKDVDVYKKANMSRKLFSKIRSQKDYHPNKKTVLALCIALRLTLDESEDLLESAGYSLSSSQKVDVIVRYFIERKEYDIFKINEMLFYYDLPLLS